MILNIILVFILGAVIGGIAHCTKPLARRLALST